MMLSGCVSTIFVSVYQKTIPHHCNDWLYRVIDKVRYCNTITTWCELEWTRSRCLVVEFKPPMIEPPLLISVLPQRNLCATRVVCLYVVLGPAWEYGNDKSLWRRQRFKIWAYAHRLQSLSREGSLSCHTVLWHGTSVFAVLSEIRSNFRLWRQARGTKDINPNPYEIV